MKPYHRRLLQARANGRAKPSDTCVSRTGHRHGPQMPVFDYAENLPAYCPPDPRSSATSSTTPSLCGNHLSSAYRSDGCRRKVRNTDSFLRPLVSRHTCTILLPTPRRKPTVIILRMMQPARSARIMLASPYGEYAHRSGVGPTSKYVDD